MPADFRLELGTTLGDGAPYGLAAADLTRHAVILGATGSGKTGLLVRLVEELLFGGVPVIAIDPKGDLAGLARGPLKGVTPTRVYTPGARTAPLELASIVAGPPPGAGETDRAELLGDVVRGLCGLAGADPDPLGPAALLASAVLDAAWSSGRALTLHDLVLQLVDPPFPRLGAFPVDTVSPRRSRMELAVRLNAWLASPALSAFAEGDPVDVDAWSTGLTVVTLPHLDDALQKLTVGWVLAKVAQWARRQPGSDTLRLAVVLDEAWGFAPPAPRDPAPKRPLLQLAKQARAVGVGVVTATQNPVDLDYALLSNAGAWFVGRLATPQDREKVSAGASDEARGWITILGPREFVVRRSGREERVRSADTRTPLRGPVTLAELAADAPPRPAAPPPAAAPAESGLLAAAPTGRWRQRWLDPNVAHAARWAPHTATLARDPGPDRAVVWAPAWLCRLQVRFDEGRTVVAEREEWRLWLPGQDAPVEPPLDPSDLVDALPGLFRPLEEPEGAAAKRLSAEVVDHVTRGETLQQFVHAGTKSRSSAGETADTFRGRVKALLEAKAAEAVRKLEDQVRKDVARLEARRDKAERALAEKKVDHSSRQTSEMVGVGEMLLGVLFGRRRSLSPALSRRTSTSKAAAAVTRTEDELAALEREVYDAESELRDRVESLTNEHLRDLDTIEALDLALEADDVKVAEWSVLWVPVTRPL